MNNIFVTPSINNIYYILYFTFLYEQFNQKLKNI